MKPAWMISPAIFSYEFEGRFYLPIIELSEEFEFFLEPELDRGYVSGWASREENSFSIDTERQELIIRGEKKTLPPDAILRSDILATDDMYVQIEILNQIWPVTLYVDLPTISISVTAQEDLSFQRELERRERRDVLVAREEFRNLRKDLSLPYVPNPYKIFGKPVLDLQSSYTFDNDTKALTGTHSINGLQQLGGFIANFGAAYNWNRETGFQRPGSIRMTLEREAVGDDDLFFGVTKLRAGDVSVRQRDLVSSSNGGRGVTISSSPNERATEFDRITFEGTGPPGWEIELYNNNTLLEFGEIDETGEYKFEDVILQFGNNTIKAVLYGPQGQIREHAESFEFGGGMLPPGDFQYQAGFVDNKRPFIFLENRPRTSPRGIASNIHATYGLNRNITTFFSYAQLPTTTSEKDYQRYLTGGFSAAALGSTVQIEAYQEIAGGSALDLRLITQFLGVRLNIRNSFFNHFVSPDTGSGSSAKRFEAQVQANTSVTLPFARINLRTKVKHLENRSGFVTTNLDTQQSISYRGLNVSHSTISRFISEIHESSTGQATASFNLRPWQLKGGFSYNIHPIWDLTTANMQLTYRPAASPFQASVTTAHGFLSDVTTVGFQTGYDFGRFLASASATHVDQRGWELTTRTNMSLTPYNEDKAYRLSSRSKRSASAVLGRIFLDYDGDGVFSEGDEPLENAHLLISGQKTRSFSNSEGYIVAEGSARKIVTIEVDNISLEDPYFRSAIKGYSTVLRPGSMPVFDFPIIETGSIDGTLYYEINDNPVPGLTLQLVNANAKVVMTSETAYDGFYAFEFVPPGIYTVRADPSYEIYVPEEIVTISSDDLFVYGIDLQIIETGSIDGTVYYEISGNPVQSLSLQLVNASAEVVTTAETTDDGFYTFEPVPPGTYTVQADPSDEINVLPETVTTASDGLSAYGVDLQLIETRSIVGAVHYEISGDPVQGLTLQLVNANAEVVMTTETTHDGFYAFELVLPGTYRVRADPSDEINVLPKTVMVTSGASSAYERDLQLIETRSINGTVHYEISGDPVQGLILQLVNTSAEVVMTAEITRDGFYAFQGLPMQPVNASAEVVMTSKTAHDGFYAFNFVPPGIYTVRADLSYEVNVPPKTLTVASGDLSAYEIDLQLIETRSINGTLHYEISGEPVQGITLQLVDASAEVVMTSETANDGFYTFEAVPPGTYMVRADPSEKVNVLPEALTVITSGDLSAYEIDLQLIETRFIVGTVHYETSGEPVQSLTLQLVNASAEVVMTAETASNGFYAFKFVPPGTYMVRADPSDKITVPPAVVTVASGDLSAYEVDLQLIETGFIVGTVRYEISGDPVQGLTLQLVNANAEIVMTSETAYDGFYAFESVLPGTYTVRADPSYRINVPPETVTVASDDLFAYGIDLQLLEQAEEARAADEAVSGESSGGVAHTRHDQGTLQPAPLPTDGNPAINQRVRTGEYPGKIRLVQDLFDPATLSTGGNSVTVQRVRIGEHPDKIRLVLDLSGPAAYRITISDDDAIVLVELPYVTWDAVKYWHGTDMSVLREFEVEELADGRGTILWLSAKSLMSVGSHGIIDPDAGHGYRLYIDLVEYRDGSGQDRDTKE